MEAEEAFNIHITPSDADRALRRFLVGEAAWIPLLAVVCCWSYFGVSAWQGRLTTWPAVVGATGLLLPLLYLTAYHIRSRRNRELFAQLGDAPVTYRFAADRLHVRSPSYSSSLGWDVVRNLWVDPDLTLIFYARNGYLTLPTEQIPDECLRFLIQQVRQNGGKIRDRRS